MGVGNNIIPKYQKNEIPKEMKVQSKVQSSFFQYAPNLGF